jgi:type IV pilus assembly protein PilB
VSLHKTVASLGEILVDSGILGQNDLQRGLEEQRKKGGRLGEVLVSLGLLTRDDLSWALSRQYALAYVHPRDLEVDPGCAERFPESLARAYNVAPLFDTGDELHVVVEDPLVLEALEEAEELRSLSLNVSLGPAEEVRELVDDLYGLAPAEPPVRAAASRSTEPAAEPVSIPDAALRSALEDATGLALVQLALEEASSRRARAVHFESDRAGGAARVRFRTDAGLVDLALLRPDWHATVVSLLEKLAGQGGRARAAEDVREGTAKFVLRGAPVRLPVTFVRSDDDVSAIVAVTAAEASAPLLSELGLAPESMQKLALLAARGFGLWLVTGHQWDGAGAIAHSLVRHLSPADRRAVSFRDDGAALAARPEFANLHVARHTSVAVDLETAMRGDFDVALVGRLFARADVEAALEAAARGKIVVGTTDFRTPRAALRFLLSFDFNRGLLAAALSGVLGQREVRVLCPHCRVADERAPRFESPKRGESPRPLAAWRGSGCARCGRTGVRAREFLLELWANDDALGRTLLASDAALRVEGPGGPGLLEIGLDRVRRGEIPFEDVAPLQES